LRKPCLLAHDIKVWAPLSAIMAQQLTKHDRFLARMHVQGRQVYDKRRIAVAAVSLVTVASAAQSGEDPWPAMAILSRSQLRGYGKFASYISLLDHFRQVFGARVEYQVRQSGPPHKPVFETEAFFEQGKGRVTVNMFGPTKAESKDLAACRAVMEIAKYWQDELLVEQFKSLDTDPPVVSTDGEGVELV